MYVVSRAAKIFFICRGIRAKMAINEVRKTIRPSQTQVTLCLPFLFVQAHKFLGSDALTLLCSNFCSKMLRVHIIKAFHAKETLVGFSNTIGTLQTRAKLCLPFRVVLIHKFQGSDALTH